jgi:hypothetical protein
MIHHIVTDLSKMNYLKTDGWTLLNLPGRGDSKMAWKRQTNVQEKANTEKEFNVRL